jgi:hypothetical protein
VRRSYSIILVAGVALGLALGAYSVKISYGVFEHLKNFMTPGTYGDFASNQYRHAAPPKAKEALLGCARFLQELNTVEPDRVKTMDIGLCYGRLALLEEADGNSQKAQTYLAKAKDSLWRAGYEKWTSTEADLRAYIAFWDGRGKLPDAK